MAGLGLMNAVDAYQQGVSWKQGQDEIARVQRQRAQLDEANQAATGVINASQAEWAANGAQGRYRPNDSTMFKAAEARGAALAKHGLWDQFMQNEAQVAPMRLKARSSALQKYESDGDIESLARTVYPTIFDGKEITGIERIEGADGSANLGLKAIPTKLKIKLSDGTTQDMEPQSLVQMVKSSLIDPQTTLRNEVMLNMERAKQAVKTEGLLTVEREKGAQTRQTEEVKGKNARGLADVKFGLDSQLHAADNDTRIKVADGNNKATLGAARIGADSRIAVAEAKAAGAAAGAKGEKDGLAVAGKWQGMAKEHFGKIAGGPFGSSRMSGQATLDLAATAQRIHEANKGSISETQALDAAAKFLKLKSPAAGQDD